MFFLGTNPALCRTGHTCLKSLSQLRSSTSRDLAIQPKEILFLFEPFGLVQAQCYKIQFIRPLTRSTIFLSLRVQPDNLEKLFIEEQTCALVLDT